MRISREAMFMEIAETVAKRSTCLRNNVGAIIVRNNNIASIGYNGVASGCEHCTLETCIGKGCNRAIHAEINALDRLLPPVTIGGIEDSLFVTVSPCIHCAYEIVRRQIQNVYYRNPYRDLEGLHYLIKYGINVYKILPSGEIIKEGTEWKGQ